MDQATLEAVFETALMDESFAAEFAAGAKITIEIADDGGAVLTVDDGQPLELTAEDVAGGGDSVEAEVAEEPAA